MGRKGVELSGLWLRRVGLGSLLGLILVGLVASGLLVGPSEEEAPDRSPRPVRVQTSAEAEADDIATIAAMEGWSIAEAERRLRDEEPFTELAAELWRRYPTTFSGAWTDHDAPDDSIRYIRFVGAVPDEARQRAAELGVVVIFRDDGIYSRNEAEALADRVHDDLLRSGFEAATGFRVLTQTIAITIRRPEQYRGESDDDLRRRLPPSARGERVRVSFTDGPILVPDIGRAGRGR